MTLWEIFSFGAVPYSAFFNQETIQQISEGYQLSIPQNCPDEVYAMMLDCWRVKPKERPSFKNIFESLDELLKNLPEGVTGNQQWVEGDTSAYLLSQQYEDEPKKAVEDTPPPVSEDYHYN